MVSFDSDFQNIPAPYLFEASELNYINGTYVYTYNTDWSDHSKQWEYDCDPPSGCSMVYMTTKTPLDPDSWVMRGECFQNRGRAVLITPTTTLTCRSSGINTICSIIP